MAAIIRGRPRPHAGLRTSGRRCIEALLGYVRSGEDKEPSLRRAASDDRPPYRFTGYRKFLDPEGYPAVAPPWGTLERHRSQQRHLSVADSAGRISRTYRWTDKSTGSENYGGPILTAGGVLFIGATLV